MAGLLALMLLTDARRLARVGPDGALIPMAEQDRESWDSGHIAEGITLISAALPRGEPVRTSCRRPSPPSMTRPRTPNPLTGRRLSRCMSCCC